MTRKPPVSGRISCLALMLALPIATAAVAGTASATFTVSARLDSSAACHLDRTVGAVQCASGGQAGSTGLSQPLQLFSGYRLQETVLLEMPETGAYRNYSAILGAYSSIRLVNFGGLDYLEMTLSW